MAKQCGIVKWNYEEQNQSSKNVCGFYILFIFVAAARIYH